MGDFDVQLTLDGVGRVFRTLEMKLGKPYLRDYRRPENSGELLKSIGETLESLEAMGIQRNQLVVGFLDEASSQTKTTPGLWSFQTSPHQEH